MTSDKKYNVQLDVTFTKTYYVEAKSETHAEQKAKHEAWDDHHGEVINDVKTVSSTLEELCDE